MNAVQTSQNPSILPTASSCGQLVAIPKSQWQDFQTRANAVVLDKNIKSIISDYIPNYDSLLSSCQTWQKTTMLGIVEYSVQLALFAGKTAQSLQDLQATLKGAKPSEKLPPTTKLIFKIHFGAINSNAQNIQQQLNTLQPEIENFAKQNQTADGYIAKYGSELGKGWQTLTVPLEALNNALNQVTLGWSVILSKLHAIIDQKIDITTAELLNSNITKLITDWQNLSATAKQFNQNI